VDDHILLRKSLCAQGFNCECHLFRSLVLVSHNSRIGVCVLGFGACGHSYSG